MYLSAAGCQVPGVAVNVLPTSAGPDTTGTGRGGGRIMIIASRVLSITALVLLAATIPVPVLRVEDAHCDDLAVNVLTAGLVANRARRLRYPAYWW